MFAMPETGDRAFSRTSARPTCCRACRAPRHVPRAHRRAARRRRLPVPPGSRTHHVAAARLEALEEALAAADLAGDAFAAVDRGARRLRCGSRRGRAAGAARADRSLLRPGEPRGACSRRSPTSRSGWGRAQLEQLDRKSPTSLAVTFRQLRSGATLDFDAAMRLEYRLVHRFMAGHDFREGVRALIIDKDNRPRWRPGRLAEVTPGRRRRPTSPRCRTASWPLAG